MPPAARLTDMHSCPMQTPAWPSPIPHVGGPIIGPGAPTVLIGKLPAAVMGDSCVCVGPPDSIIKGSATVMICGKPAARMGDTTAHGGSIIAGWAFPPVFHPGVSPIAMVSEEEDIRQSLCIILSTHLGERVVRPEFGSELHNMVYHNMDLTARTQLRASVENAILHFESRITLTNVEFDVSEERVGKMSILLEYTIRLTNARGNLVYPYYYDEHF